MSTENHRLICTTCNTFDYYPPDWERTPGRCPVCGAGTVVPAYEAGRLPQPGAHGLIGYSYTPPADALSGPDIICPVCQQRRSLSADTTVTYDQTRRFLLPGGKGGRWRMYVALFVDVPAGVPVCGDHEPLDISSESD